MTNSIDQRGDNYIDQIHQGDNFQRLVDSDNTQRLAGCKRILVTNKFTHISLYLLNVLFTKAKKSKININQSIKHDIDGHSLS